MVLFGVDVAVPDPQQGRRRGALHRPTTVPEVQETRADDGEHGEQECGVARLPTVLTGGLSSLLTGGLSSLLSIIRGSCTLLITVLTRGLYALLTRGLSPGGEVEGYGVACLNALAGFKRRQRVAAQTGDEVHSSHPDAAWRSGGQGTGSDRVRHQRERFAEPALGSLPGAGAASSGFGSDDAVARDACPSGGVPAASDVSAVLPVSGDDGGGIEWAADDGDSVSTAAVCVSSRSRAPC